MVVNISGPTIIISYKVARVQLLLEKMSIVYKLLILIFFIHEYFGLPMTLTGGNIFALFFYSCYELLHVRTSRDATRPAQVKAAQSVTEQQAPVSLMSRPSEYWGHAGPKAANTHSVFQKTRAAETE